MFKVFSNISKPNVYNCIMWTLKYIRFIPLCRSKTNRYSYNMKILEELTLTLKQMEQKWGKYIQILALAFNVFSSQNKIVWTSRKMLCIVPPLCPLTWRHFDMCLKKGWYLSLSSVFCGERERGRMNRKEQVNCQQWELIVIV